MAQYRIGELRCPNCGSAEWDLGDTEPFLHPSQRTICCIACSMGWVAQFVIDFWRWHKHAQEKGL